MAPEVQACPASVLAMDRDDPLAEYRLAFELPAEVAYFDGNSLGALPRVARERVSRAVELEWGQSLVGGWNEHDWIGLAQATGEKIAPLLGADAGQVLVTDSISVNLFKLICAALQMRPGRTRILTDALNFPTDQYIVQGVAELLGPTRVDLEPLPVGEIPAALDETVALVLLSHVDYRSGQVHDMRTLTAAAHASGALVLWDLAHSAGALQLTLDADQVDLAVGCGYKFLNGGPGAPAFVYVATRHQAQVQQPLQGWMGHAQPFAFDASYRPAAGVQRFASGTPPILSLTALHAAVQVFDGVDMQQLREKSMALGVLCQQLIQARDSLQKLTMASPLEPAARGSQLSYRHPAAYEICQALISHDVVADFRSPDILRIGFAPLYLRFADVWRLVDTLDRVVSAGEYLNPEFKARQRVT
ncbi:MAG: kynureninase [Pseudomonadales bacterium]